MNIKECTRTKGGHKVEIMKVVDGVAYGTLEYCGVKLAKWLETGKAIFVEGLITPKASELINPEVLDLPNWRDEIPWDSLIDEIEWVARDETGGWYGYETKPESIHSVWVSNQTCSRLKAVKGMPPGPADWREAIARRPK